MTQPPADPSRDLPPISADDVYQLTNLAIAELHGSQTSLHPEELELLVLVDGFVTVAEVARRARTIAPAQVEEGLRKMLHDKLIMPAAKATSDSLDFSNYLSASALLAATSSGSASTAELDDGQLELQKQGFYVRIARRASQERKLAEGEKLQVLIVEDEQHLAKLLRTFLTLEGFTAQVASNRDEILKALRSAPRPDLVLLDVMLPDADGFQILNAMRKHPALKAVPVVMLTSKDSRDAVLKGLSGGATGYITKPFEIEVLMKAVHAVLGLSTGSLSDKV